MISGETFLFVDIVIYSRKRIYLTRVLAFIRWTFFFFFFFLKKGGDS